MPIPLNKDEIQQIADVAAEKSIRRLLVTLGVDASDNQAVIDMQQDFRAIRTWRKAKEAAGFFALKATITVLVTGFIGFLMVKFGFKG